MAPDLLLRRVARERLSDTCLEIPAEEPIEADSIAADTFGGPHAAGYFFISVGPPPSEEAQAAYDACVEAATSEECAETFSEACVQGARDACGPRVDVFDVLTPTPTVVPPLNIEVKPLGASLDFPNWT